ncbi:ribbon-helix-helix domain-containing protein [Sphingobium sp. B2]|uniref:ribbon-helix-helix domain-containing protein n=1 Tax=Sphingobium sp. B2 TaxID=2583228 RepID=UPI001C9846CD|nr:ribbon-helix-helix domain-containing protein [Sphingobium sp. B2]
MAGYETCMGRPPLGVKTTVVRLPDGLAERIDDLIGPNRRAKFIRDIVEREVERLESERKAKSGGASPG